MACMQSPSWERWIRTPLTPAEAIETARRIARDRGWPWTGAVRVSHSVLAATFGRHACEVLSNAGRRGCNVRVVVDVESGRLLHAAFFAPRLVPRPR